MEDDGKQEEEDELSRLFRWAQSLGQPAVDLSAQSSETIDGRTNVGEDRNGEDEQILASLLMKAVSPSAEYPQILLSNLEQMGKRVVLSDAEFSTLFRGLLVYSRNEAGLRIELENNRIFFRALCLLTSAGRRVQGIEPGRLMGLLSQTLATTSENELAVIALIMVENLLVACPRLRGDPSLPDILRSCIATIENAPSSLRLQMALEVLGNLPVARTLSQIADKLARALCAALTMKPAKNDGVDNGTLDDTITDLCRTLLAGPGRHIFYAAITKIARSKPATESEVEIVRGAVYLIGMALWSHKKVANLSQEVPLSTACAILRSAASLKQDGITMEVAFSVRRLVKKYGADLDVEWDSILALVEELVPSAEKYPPVQEITMELTALYLQTTPALLADPKSELYETKKQLLETTIAYEQMGNLLDKCKDVLPEHIALKLMQARASSAEPWRGLVTYVDVLQKVMLLYYRGESREQIRLETLDTIREALWTYQGLYDDTLVSEALLPFVGQHDLNAEGSPSANEELKLICDVARDLPLSDVRFSALVHELDEPARKGTKASTRATELVLELLYARMIRTPISRSVSVFKSLASIHMHSPSRESRAIAIEAVRTISATSQYRIIGKDVHSYSLVSHLRSARRGRESSAIVLFPIQFAVVNLVQRLREETDEELSLAVCGALEALLANVFVVRECNLDWLAKQLLEDARAGIQYTARPDLRGEIVTILYMLSSYGVEVDDITDFLLDELTSTSSTGCSSRKLLNYLYALLSSKPRVGGAEKMLQAIEVWFADFRDDENELLCMLECLKDMPSMPFKEDIGQRGMEVVVKAVHLAQRVSEENAPRWRRLCFAAYVLWARKAPASVVNSIAMELGKSAANGDLLCAACVEYAGCFRNRDDRTNAVYTRGKHTTHQAGTPVTNFVVGIQPFQYLVSITTSTDGPTEIVQRRPTGTSRFWVQPVHKQSTLRFDDKTKADGGPAEQHADVTLDVGKDSVVTSVEQEGRKSVNATEDHGDQSTQEECNIAGLANLTMEQRKPSKVKRRDAFRRTFDTWEAIQQSDASAAPGDPVQLLCQLGRGGSGVTPLPEADELIPHSLSVLDRLPAEDTHRIGLIYVGEDDGDETSILDNIAGSEAYLAFLRNLGTFIRLGKSAMNVFTGGLDVSGRDVDGEYCLHWGDGATQVVFHVTTMMPNSERSGGGVLKKRHVGNDHVNVIWSEKGPDFDAKEMVDSQFNSVHIVVSPGGRSLYRVRVRVNKKGMRPFGPLRQNRVEVVSEESLGALVRSTAINADVVCSNAIANWEDRAVQIGRIGERAKLDPANPVVLV